MFKDKVKIKIKAGHGGGGKVGFDRTMRPNGGDGGDGGDVYVVGDQGLYDLGSFHRELWYKADNGEHGGGNQATGAKGKDLFLRVPLVTTFYDQDGETVIVVDKHNEPQLLLKGGVGGLGNYYFRKHGRQNRRKHTPGRDGEELFATLELELASDIIFIGLPNAGKSSILRELTNADAKVASYAFTTLMPQLGRLDDVTLMDLPGLIEGTAEGKGLGTGFVRHTRRSKVVAHFISLEGDVVEAYRTIRRELKQVDPNLAAKPELIVLTKTDLSSVEQISQAISVLKKEKDIKIAKTEIMTTSAYDLESLQTLATKLKQMVA